jgi:MYXO-CTERM domain-containing protein
MFKMLTRSLALVSLTLGTLGLAHAQMPTGVATLLFDLSNFSSQGSANLSATSGLVSNLYYEAFDGSAMRGYTGGAGFLKTQYAASGQTSYDAARNDWFYTLCVEPTAYLNVPSHMTLGSTQDFVQPFRTGSNPMAGDLMAMLYHEFGNRNPATPLSTLAADDLGRRVGMQVAVWEILSDFDPTAPGYGLGLSGGKFNFKTQYAGGQTNRVEFAQYADEYLSYARQRAARNDVSGYEAQLFVAANTTDANGVRRGQDLMGGRSIPEPGSAALALLALPALGAFTARRRRR